jgi:site-specific recombinase XerD
MAAATKRSYTQTLNRLTAEHGTLPLGALDGSTLDAFTAAAWGQCAAAAWGQCAAATWGQCAAATWNRHIATLRSFTAFAQRRGWLTADPAGVLERRNEPADRTKAIAAASLERLFRREDVAIREKCLWRTVYETAARTQEVLSADVTDLDLENKAPARTAQRRRQRLAALPIRLSTAPAQTNRRPRRRADLPRRPPPQPRPRADGHRSSCAQEREPGQTLLLRSGAAQVR